MAMTREELEELEGTAAAPAHTITAEMAAAIDPVGEVLITTMQLFKKQTIEQLTKEHILFVAALGGEVAVAVNALEHGADINAPISMGFKPLHIAVRRMDHRMVKFLLQHRADPNGFCSDYFTYIARLIQDDDKLHNPDCLLILRELLRCGAEADFARKEWPDEDASSRVTNTSLLVEKKVLHRIGSDVNSAELSFGATFAPHFYFDEMIEMLLDYGADLREARRNFIAVAEYRKEEANRRLVDSRNSLQRETDEPTFGLSAEDQERFLKQRQDDVLASEERVASLELWKEAGLKCLQEIRLRREEKLRGLMLAGRAASVLPTELVETQIAPSLLAPQDAAGSRMFWLGHAAASKEQQQAIAIAAQQQQAAARAAARASAVDAMAARMLVGSVPSAAANPAEPEHKGASTQRARSMRP